jgi:predicted transcriptional regulator
MDELIGFISGNKNRRKLLAILASKNGLEGSKIAKNMRIASPSADKVLSELLEKKLVVQNGTSFNLTDQGAAVEKRMQSI